jgi:hypothetical protein
MSAAESNRIVALMFILGASGALIACSHRPPQLPPTYSLIWLSDTRGEDAARSAAAKLGEPILIIGEGAYRFPLQCLPQRYFGAGSKADIESRSFGSAAEGRNLSSAADERSLGSQTEGRQLGAQNDQRNLGAQNDGRNFGAQNDQRNLGTSSDSMRCRLAENGITITVLGFRLKGYVYDPISKQPLRDVVFR